MNQDNSLAKLDQIIENVSILQKGAIENLSASQNHDFYNYLRQYLFYYQDYNSHCKKSKIEGKYIDFAAQTIRTLGGSSEPCIKSLRDYNSDIYGPFLGVSDEGSAVDSIIAAAFDSPKSQSLEYPQPLQIGVAHDAEILASSGEVCVGPDEYSTIRANTIGKILTSTNIGARVNVKYYKTKPIITINNYSDKDLLSRTILKLRNEFIPFWKTSNGLPRPHTVLISFKSGIPFDIKKKILKQLLNKLNEGTICDPIYHKIGLLAFVRASTKGLDSTIKNIDLAHEAGIEEFTLWGRFRNTAEDNISMVGLLNYFSAKHTTQILDYSKLKGISIVLRNQIDPQTISRNIWTGLQIAKSMGLELGKYGLIPLDLEESNIVMQKIQSWLTGWTAAPVLYIDSPIVSKDNVYENENLVRGIKVWLDIIHNNRIPVILIDTYEKSKSKRLLKNDNKDSKGILKLDEIIEILDYANKKLIKVLWAGGIEINQVFEFGKMNVFGIYVTSSVSEKRAITTKYLHEPMAFEKEPTYYGITNAKILIEAGFLVTKLKNTQYKHLINEMEYHVQEFLHCLEGLLIGLIF